MTDPNDYILYTRLADELIEQAGKDQLADATKILAINIGW